MTAEVELVVRVSEFPVGTLVRLCREYQIPDSLFTKFYNKESVSKAVSIQTWKWN